MKKLTLLFSVLLGFSPVFSQINLTVGAPANTGATTQLRAPNGTTAHTTLRGHIIVTAAEMAGIPAGTSLTGLGFLYSAGGLTAAGGNIQFYLENTTDATNLKSATWATAISTMTSVYNSTFTIPTVAGSSNVTLSTPFTYTGGGLYVAYDYLGSTFTTGPATYLCNNNLGGGVKVDVSATTTPPATLTQSSSFRPEIEFTFPNPFTNNLAVMGMFPDYGQDNILFGNTQNIDAVIRNISSGTLTNIPVSLAIAGANPYTGTQTIATIAPGADVVVNFTGVPKTAIGNQTVTVSLPADQQTSNDTLILTQDVSCDVIGYGLGDSITGGLGYNTAAGILANLFVLPAGAPINIKQVVPTISDAPAVNGNVIKGVLLNSAGVIIDSTANHTIIAADLGAEVPLTFINGNVDYAGDSVYVGFRQTANATTGYFPLATQDIAGVTPADLFCGFGTFGGAYANYTTFGSFLISAVIDAPVGLSSNSFGGQICSGTPLNLTVNAGMDNYDFIIDGSSAQNGTLTTYSYTPTATTTAVVNSNIGVCQFADSITVSQVSAVTSSISAGICQGASYNFNGQTLSVSGTYLDTLPSSAGCDSIITLTLMDLQATSSSSTASICSGDSYTFAGQTLTAAGTYFDTLTNAAGCDSVISLTLSLNPTVTATATASGSTLTGTATPATSSLQWVNCPSYSVIAGATSASYQPTALVGDYALIATSPAGCSDTSACITIDQTGLDELDLSSTVDLFPNPTVNVINAVSKADAFIGFRVYDMTGRTILISDLEAGSTQVSFNTEGFENGMYKLELYTSQNTIVKTFVKK